MISMQRALRYGILCGLVVLTMLGAMLPSWGMCRHRDGTPCTELVQTACCNEHPSAPRPDDESCTDCVDIASTPALKAELATSLDAGALQSTAPIALVLPPLAGRIAACPFTQRQADAVDHGPKTVQLARALRC